MPRTQSLSRPARESLERLERRPHLDRLLADCRRRAADAVVVYRYDRFARSLRQLVNALEEFRALEIDFISLHKGWTIPHPTAGWCSGSSPRLLSLNGN